MRGPPISESLITLSSLKTWKNKNKVRLRGRKKIRICILLNTPIVTTRVQLTLFLFWIILKPSICLPLSTFGCLWWVCYDSNASYPFISRHFYGSLLNGHVTHLEKFLGKGEAKAWRTLEHLGLPCWNGTTPMKEKKTPCLCLLEDENQNDKRVSLFMEFIPHLIHQPDRTV